MKLQKKLVQIPLDTSVWMGSGPLPNKADVISVRDVLQGNTLQLFQRYQINRTLKLPEENERRDLVVVTQDLFVLRQEGYNT